MPNYTIRCVGFEPQQQASIVAILDLAGSALNSSWIIIDHIDSDIIMINMDGETESEDRNDHQETPSYRIIMVAEKTEQNSNDYWFLAKKEHGPPSLRELIQLLNQVDICLLEASEKKPLKITEPKKVVELEEVTEIEIENKIEPEDELEIDIDKDVPKKRIAIDKKNAQTIIDLSNANDSKLHKPTRKLIAKNYFFGLLIYAKKDKGFKVIKLYKMPTLYISSENNSFYFAGSKADLVQFCTASPRVLNNKNISETKFNKLLQNEAIAVSAQNLDALLGYSIIIASQGRLIDGLLAEQTVKLKQLPNNDQIPILACYQTISELMYQQENNLFDVAEKLQIPLSEVFNCFNICYFFENIQVITPEKKPVIPETEKNSDNKNAKTLGHFLTSFFNK